MAMRVAVVPGYGQSVESKSIVRFNDFTPCRHSSLYGWPNADADDSATGGSIWGPWLDHLRTKDVNAAMFNHAVGSTGILFNWSGYLTTYSLGATFTAGRYVKVGSNIYKANGIAGTQFVADASTPPPWGNILNAVYNEATGGGSWTCVAVGTSDATGKLYAPGDALYDPLGLVAGQIARIATLAPRFDKIWPILQGGQSDFGLSQPLYEQAHINLISLQLSVAPNVEPWVGVTMRRWDGGAAPVWDTFYKPARENILSAFAGSRRVHRGGDCSTNTAAMMLPENGGSLLLHPNRDGRDNCVHEWSGASDAAGVYPADGVAR